MRNIRAVTGALALWIAVVATTLAPSTAGAQAYPSKPVRVIVPNAAGGPPDIIGRAFTQKLSEQMGQQFFIDNRGGVGGALGIAAVAKSVPDGHTLLFSGLSALVVSPVLFKDVEFDPVESFSPAAMVGRSNFVLVVNPSLPVKTVAEFVAHAKARPGKLNYTGGAVATPPHIVMEIFKVQTSIELVAVNYKGSAPGIAALLANEVQAAVDQLAGLQSHIGAGKLRPLVVSAEKRMRQLPDVPSATEAGVPNFIVGTWFGLLAPKAVAADVVRKLNAEGAKAVQTRELAELLDRQGLDPASPSPEEFAAVVRADAPRWAAAVRASGAKAE